MNLDYRSRLEQLSEIAVTRRDDTVVFLDFDGVIRTGGYQAEGFKAEFRKDIMLALSAVVNRTGAQVVVTSDWRNALKKAEIDASLSPHLSGFLHKDWMTPICGHRWNEVQRWLEGHPEVSNYVILEDFAPHFEEAPSAMKSRVILCNGQTGLMNHQLLEVERLLTNKVHAGQGISL